MNMYRLKMMCYDRLERRTMLELTLRWKGIPVLHLLMTKNGIGPSVDL